MAKVSQAVQDRFKIATTVISALDFHAVEVIGVLNERLFPGGDAAFDVACVLSAHRDLLIRVRDQMQVADEELTAEAADDKQYRDARDDANARLTAAVESARAMLEAAYDESLLTFYGLVEAPPRAPGLLKEYAEKVVVCLRHRPLEQSSPYGFSIDLGLLADKIETELIPLSVALEDIEREVLEIRQALDARNRAMVMFDETYESVAEVIHGYFLLARRPDLAELVRPTSRRRRGQPEVSDLLERGAVKSDEENSEVS